LWLNLAKWLNLFKNLLAIGFDRERTIDKKRPKLAKSCKIGYFYLGFSQPANPYKSTVPAVLRLNGYVFSLFIIEKNFIYNNRKMQKYPAI